MLARSRLTALSLGLLLAGAAPLSASAQAPAAAPSTRIIKMETDGSTLPAKRELTTGSMKIVAGTYAPRENGAVVGYSDVHGKQYSIGTPRSAEVIHVARGSIVSVTADGTERLVEKGYIGFIPPGLTSTAKDADRYVHQYIVFPFDEARLKDKQVRTTLDPTAIPEGDFVKGPTGGVHELMDSGRGGKVLAWRPSASGRVQSAPDTRYVAIKTGSIEFKDGDRTIRAGGGDTLYIPRGATYSWTASGAAAIVVAIAPAAS